MTDQRTDQMSDRHGQTGSWGSYTSTTNRPRVIGKLPFLLLHNKQSFLKLVPGLYILPFSKNLSILILSGKTYCKDMPLSFKTFFNHQARNILNSSHTHSSSTSGLSLFRVSTYFRLRLIRLFQSVC